MWLRNIESDSVRTGIAEMRQNSHTFLIFSIFLVHEVCLLFILYAILPSCSIPLLSIFAHSFCNILTRIEATLPVHNPYHTRPLGQREAPVTGTPVSAAFEANQREMQLKMLVSAPYESVSSPLEPFSTVFGLIKMMQRMQSRADDLTT
jgi:hypothetical protein